MFKSVVVGVDGRQGGWDAIALARALAPDARLTLVTAYGFAAFPPTYVGFNVAADAIRKGALEVLERAVAERAPGAATRALAFTAPGFTLQRVAGDIGADLIIVGSAHRGAVGRVLIGDDSLSTVHGAACPVAVAPRGFEHRAAPPARILVGFDGRPESRAALGTARALAARAGAHLTLAAVVPAPSAVAVAYAYAFDWSELVDTQRRDTQELVDRTVAELPDASGEVLLGKPAEELARIADDQDLVVIGSRGWGAVRRVVVGGTADGLIRRAPCAVLVVPRPAGVPAEPPAMEMGAERDDHSLTT